MGIDCDHDWKVWAETDGQSQRCIKCGAYRDTPSPLTRPERGSQDQRSSAGNGGEPVNISGWKLVPDSPTEAMWQAGRTADIDPGDSYSKVWRAMFDAAPNVDDCETVSHTAQPQAAQESRRPPSSRPGWWTWDEGSAERGVGNLYYFAPANATPPPYKTQRHVTAIIDIASDGTLAGVELIEDMPAPSSSSLTRPERVSQDQHSSAESESEKK